MEDDHNLLISHADILNWPPHELFTDEVLC